MACFLFFFYALNIRKSSKKKKNLKKKKKKDRKKATLGMGVRVFGSGSDRFFSGPDLLDPKYLDSICT